MDYWICALNSFESLQPCPCPCAELDSGVGTVATVAALATTLFRP